ncbi:2-succinyl-6-hydroxy-2,4-cyclohexadiene-1-carboxylate synthase [Fredinandcohnia sp. QZ13]|uniref:2-succinyl-6-hydroxy-2, 4-cyclohexadiene-1-carboxylate synthase n=1 Tax=Fredinandcohnia sp. QZ13 TaxID=3073144 RepID=UPI0028537028|nr:2-succinyl-6-hydroxy-2,4-cyclohexadiene-1-carboxylate synthase [Fredinandcohnia sp. QZ13]MDR4889340.1 2-succinyl-6-hydroxy-2,4-cyclohexadiene-1-carboxylate synthase [Fredinandcohnia sp. QZ13]
MYISSNGSTYHVKVLGEGTPIVLLHGFTGSMTTWNQTINILKQQFQCVLIDIVGHGKSDSPRDFTRYQIEKVAHDIIHILDVLMIPLAHIAGYSMGGRLALVTAILYPTRVASLILESSSPGLKTIEERAARRKSDEQLAKLIEQEGIIKFVDYWENIPLFTTQKALTKEKQLEIRKQRLENNPVGLANSLRGMGTGAQPTYWDRLNKVKCPTLLLCGELDQKFCTNAEEMGLSIQNARVEKIVEAGHAIHVEQPYFFGKIIIEFVSDHFSL